MAVGLAVAAEHPRRRREVFPHGVQVVGEALAACEAPGRGVGGSRPPAAGRRAGVAAGPLTVRVLLPEALVAVLDVQVLQVAPHLLLVLEVDQAGHAGADGAFLPRAPSRRCAACRERRDIDAAAGAAPPPGRAEPADSPV